MRLRDNESYYDWADRVQDHEYRRAKEEVTKGKNIDRILETMSYRITNKLLHPIYRAIMEQHISEFDPVKDRDEYYKKFLQNHTPVADHVAENLFDNRE